MKRLLIAFLLAITLLFVLPVTSFAASGDFVLSDDGKILIEYKGSDEVVTIPDGVETIGTCAFYGNSSIKKIVMPDSVTAIENQAFRFCDEVTEIVWSKNLKTIDFSALEGLRSLKVAELPDSIEHLDDYSFNECNSLEYVKLPQNITEIGEESFNGSDLFRAIDIPDNVTNIKKGSFENCNDLFTIVGSSGSAAQEYAENNNIRFSTKGVDVPFTSKSDSHSYLKVTKNGTALGSSAQLKTGDVLRITATTDYDDLNVTVNGKSLNYCSYRQETKSELHDFYMIVTGPVDISVISVNKGKNLDESLNAAEGSMHFTGEETECTVDQGRRIVTFAESLHGSISTKVDVKKTTYLIFDMKVRWANNEKLNVYFSIDGNEEVFDLDRTSTDYDPFVYELAPGKHTISWSTYSGHDSDTIRFGLSNVRLTTDINEVNAISLSIPYDQVDLDVGESLALDYELKPDFIERQRAVQWSSSNESVVTAVNGTVTGISKGKAKVTATIDGISSSVMVYVSGNSKGNADVADNSHDESSLVSEKTYIADDAGYMFNNENTVHVRGSSDAYLYNDNDLYRLKVVEKNSSPEKLLTTDMRIVDAVSRGKIIYLFTREDYGSGNAAVIGYDTSTDKKVYEQAFQFEEESDDEFAVDDEGNIFFVFNNKDLYSYDKNGNLISKDIQSGGKLISGLGTIKIGQVDPFNYSVLVTYLHTMSRGLTDMENYTYSGFGAVFGGYNESTYCGLRSIRNGEIIGSSNFIKNREVAEGGGWTFLDKGNYAVNTNGAIDRFYKDRKSKSGVNYERITSVYGFTSYGYGEGPAATYAGGSVYMANNENVVYRVSLETGDVEGTYDIGDKVLSLISANGKAFCVCVDKDYRFYVTPLKDDMYTKVQTKVRKEHITLTYGRDEVEKAFLGSEASADYYKESNLYASKPSWKAPYKAGALSESVKKDTLARLNYSRWQYGINPLTLNDQYMERSQKGAVAMAANDELTHYPDQPADMDDEFYAEACKGTGADYDYSGNCSSGDSVFDAIKGYLDDTLNMQEGSIGHRLSMLDTNAVKTSFGQAGGYSCMSIYTSEDEKPDNHEEFYAWPSAGYFPSKMISSRAIWHVKTDWYQCKKLKVKLTYKGTEYQADSVGMDEGAFIFKLPENLRKAVVKNTLFADGTEIDVEVSGFNDKLGNPIVVSYPVKFVNSNEANDPEYEDPADKNGNGDDTSAWVDPDGKKNEPDGESEIGLMDEMVRKRTGDSDLKGSSFIKLRAKISKRGKTYQKLTWRKVKGAKVYYVYATKCGKTNKFKLKKKTSGTAFTHKKLKKGTYYKYLVVACNSKGKVVSISKIVHSATAGGKYTNPKSIKTAARKNKVTIKKGKKFKLKAKVRKASLKLKLRTHRKIRYQSANPKIAVVTSKGVIKGKKKGTTYVYAYAQNGVYKRIKVRVK